MEACIFCGKQKKLSDEHIFPHWLQKYLKIEQDYLYIYGNEPLQVKQRIVFDAHVNNKVCKTCNNKWMHKLEDKSIPIIKSLLENNTYREIPVSDTRILARWIQKTVLTLHAASLYEKVVPDKHYKLAYLNKAPPHMMIAIARLARPIDHPSWIQSQNWLGAEQYFSSGDLENALRQTYRITLGFGQFAARVHYFPLDIPLFPLEDGIQYIHPRSQTFAVVWPPKTSIDDLWELDQGLVVAARLDKPLLDEP